MQERKRRRKKNSNYSTWCEIFLASIFFERGGGFELEYLLMGLGGEEEEKKLHDFLLK